LHCRWQPGGPFVPLAGAGDSPTTETEPFLFDGDRVYAELAFVRPDGTVHRTLAFVDLGSPSLIVSKALFNEFGLDQKKLLTFLVGKMIVKPHRMKLCH
jgi:hypothetical protein